jgi:thiol-disulfide isomerase/thioredoxin
MNLACLTAALLAISSPGDPSGSNNTMLLDFRADWCGPCRSMDPAVSQLIGEGYPVRRVNIDQERELATRFNVQGIPCFVMLVNGKEVDRVVGATDRGRLDAMFSRNGVGPAVNAVRGQSPSTGAPMAKSVPFPPADRRGLLSGLARSSQADSMPSGRMVELDPLIVSKSNPAPDASPSTPDKLIRATVRLKIEDDKGNSVGSGTIIDAREGEALIITCGHVFRDAVKGGRILVDLFGPNAPRGVLGHLIDYDLQAEVGLIRIETNYPVVFARMAPPSYAMQTGDNVISVGCDGGADATVKETHVTSINRYSGAKNLEVAFQPVQGRSGGGLFTPDGLVVGVCYAADPEANEGLFAALPALCDELDKAGLGFVCRPDQQADSRRGNRRGENFRQSEVPADADRGRFVNSASGTRAATGQDRLVSSPGNVTPTSARSFPQAAESISNDERAALKTLADKSKQAELICILHPTGDPQAKSEIFVLDRVSPNFMRQLTEERSASSQHLTSLEIPSDPAPQATNAVVQSRPAALPVLDLPPWWAEILNP